MDLIWRSLAKSARDDKYMMVFEKKNKFSLARAILHTLQGIRDLWRHERAFRLEIYILLILAPIISILNISVLFKLTLVLLLLFTMVVEAINSAIEAVVDRISMEIHEQSRLAKDMGSAAVGITLFMNAMAWIYALWLQFSWQLSA
jgi:diacylglycerol kinase (ATP)